jgi:4-hydroxybenzoate polyprenyltransferase
MIGRPYPVRVRTLRGLVLACHPLPCVAVTAFAVAYALAVGLTAGRTALLGAAVFTGQLSIGWCNDAVDARRDAAAGRLDKPLAVGLVSRRVTWVATGAALLACVGLSLALGPEPGAVHLACVAGGWAYDLGVKATQASPLPYALSFGLLPAVATWSVADGGWPPAGVTAGAALLGVGAHFANTVGDCEADAVTGVRGLPQRIGPLRSLSATAAAVCLAAVVLGAGLPQRGAPSLALLVAGGSLAAGGAALAGRARGRRTAFRLTVLAVASVVAGFVAGS